MNLQLGILLTDTENLATVREKLVMMISTANEILTELPLREAAEVRLALQQNSSGQKNKYINAKIISEKITDGSSILKTDNFSKVEFWSSDLVENIMKLKSDCFFSHDILMIPIWRREKLLAAFQIKGIDKSLFDDNNKKFVNMMSRLLAISLENISLRSELEDKVKEQNQQLIEGECTAKLEELAAMVAHELNNALTGINVTADYLMNGPSLDTDKIWHCWEFDQEGDQLKACLEDWQRDWLDFRKAAGLVDMANQRAMEVVRAWRSLVGSHSRVMAAVNVCEVFREVVSLHRPRLIDLQIIENFEAEQLEINSTSGKVGRIFVNLIANAIEVLKEEKNPTLIVDICQHKKGVKILFRDNGPGISAEMVANFFKSKSGSGVSLWIIRRIVIEYGGTIDVESEEGKGTTFKIWLPYQF